MDPSNKLIQVLLTVVTLVLSITVHEWAHAFAAYRLGDDTAAREGRLTLNPVSHADPLGTLILPVVFTLMGPGMLFGWGRPVPYVPTNFTRKVSMRAGEAIVAFAGPLSNLILAIVCGGLFFGLPYSVLPPTSPFYPLLQNMVSLNVVLFFFNLLPVPPLDGSKIAAWVFGGRADKALDAIQQAGPMALMVVILLGGTVIAWPVRLVLRAIQGGFTSLFS